MRNLFKSLYLFIPFFLVLASCGMFQTKPDNQLPTADISAESATLGGHDYVVQPGDILTISVWKENDLQGNVAVRPDGGLNFPLVGVIDTTGKTIEQLQKEITARLTKYVPNPVVTVSVRQSSGYKIYITGKVNKPGEYTATRNIDVMQALSMAGGLSPYASPNNIKILRRVKGDQISIPFEYSRVEKGEDLKQNIILQGGDVVVVP